MNQEIKDEEKFDNCVHREWRKFDSPVGCCPTDRKIETIEGYFCPERNVAQLSAEFCLDCWMFKKK